MSFDDVADGRIGQWMHTSMGTRFYPQDLRRDEIHIGNIANGLAQDIRYGGQNDVFKPYTVAEHTVLGANYIAGNRAITKYLTGVYGHEDAVIVQAKLALIFLLHDAAEGHLGDMPRAIKHALGDAYRVMEDKLERMIYNMHGLWWMARDWEPVIKEIDRRLVPIEKQAIMRYPQPWAYDQFRPLSGVKVENWSAPNAKRAWLHAYYLLCQAAKIDPITPHTEVEI